MLKSIMMINILFLILLTAGCGGSMTIPESELKTYPPQKLLDLGAERYSQYDYDAAIYYYTIIEKIYTEDNEANNEAKAWAKYELGYIYFQQSKYNEAYKSFDSVLKIRTQTLAPQILASQMKDKMLTYLNTAPEKSLGN